MGGGLVMLSVFARLVSALWGRDAANGRCGFNSPSLSLNSLWVAGSKKSEGETISKCVSFADRILLLYIVFMGPNQILYLCLKYWRF